MGRHTWISALTLLTILALAFGAIGMRSPAVQAFEQGSITVTKTWAPGQEPNEVVEVCFAITQDADGIEVLDTACTFDDSYSVTFGPSNPPLATGVFYYVWEDAGPGWMVTGDNPIEVSIPDATGRANVSFENERAVGTASVTIHKSTCPEGESDLFGNCHDNRVPDVHFTIEGQRVVTDDDGVANAEVASGPVQITEAAVDFSATATAGAAYVYCAVEADSPVMLYDALADHRSIEFNVPTGTSVVCDWYDLTGSAAATGKLELHKRVCPNGNPTGDIFEECHDFPPEQPVGFSVDGGVARYVDAQGNVTFTGLSTGNHAVQETEGPPLAYVALAVWCSVQGTDGIPFQVQPDGPNFTVPVGPTQHVICDVYNIPLDLSGLTPTPTSPGPPPATSTSTAVPPTATATPLPPTATSTPIVGRPMHVHAGTCENLTNEPRYNLTDLATPTGATEGSERATVAESSYSVIGVSLDDLLDRDFAINVHASREETRDFVACGEIGGPVRSDGSVVVGLRELNDSGLTGIAYLIPDPSNANRTRVSVFMAPGLADEDPTLKPVSEDTVVIRSAIDRGPVSPEFQSGYEITIYGSGRVEIEITPPGASDALGSDATADQQRQTTSLSDTELTELLTDLQRIGYFELPQEDEVNPDNLVVGGSNSVLGVTLVDGTWTVNGNGLSEDQADTLDAAQQLVSDAVGGVELP